jgi:hypothetical protein
LDSYGGIPKDFLEKLLTSRAQRVNRQSGRKHFGGFSSFSSRNPTNVTWTKAAQVKKYVIFLLVVTDEGGWWEKWKFLGRMGGVKNEVFRHGTGRSGAQWKRENSTRTHTDSHGLTRTHTDWHGPTQILWRSVSLTTCQQIKTALFAF